MQETCKTENCPCKVGATVFFLNPCADHFTVCDDAAVTQVVPLSEGFCFQFAEELSAHYEVHHFIPFSSVGTIAFFSREEAEKALADHGHNKLPSDFFCLRCAAEIKPYSDNCFAR